MKTKNSKYVRFLVISAALLLIYFAWGRYGFYGARVLGYYDADKKVYRTFWGAGTNLKCVNGTCRILFYTPFTKHGIIDTTGKLTVPFKYDMIFEEEKNGLFYVQNNGKYGVINAKNKVIVPAEYQYLKINDYYIRASLDDGIGSQKIKSCVYDFNGKPIFPVTWLHSLMFNENDTNNTNPFLIGGFDAVSYIYFFRSKEIKIKNTRIHSYYALDENAKETYVVITKPTSETQERRYFLMDKSGNDLLTDEYDFIESVKNDTFLIQQNNKFGLFDAIHRQWILPINYFKNDISVMLNGHLIGVKKGNSFRYSDKQGNVILSEKNQIINFNNEMIHFKHINGKNYHLIYNEEKNCFLWYKDTKSI